MPLPSRAISHARGHLRVSRFARRTYCRKKERLLVVYLRDDKTNNANLHNTDNNPNWQEANRGAERGTTKDKSNSISFLSSSAICLKQHSVTRNLKKKQFTVEKFKICSRKPRKAGLSAKLNLNSSTTYFWRKGQWFCHQKLQLYVSSPRQRIYDKRSGAGEGVQLHSSSRLARTWQGLWVHYRPIWIRMHVIE